ncbi:glycoside hydrolase family 130 protein [Pedobacter sandarakinus]|uniref:glycoside hydrolase family 130 protein n=1 Tax=Pedobacter sandarakinus TaxID=353156 RepID=UPI002245F352|nr:glycoside hydrolase family 130 protein [Pedobacter sandarakinus]MCX2574117.1 glycoside hydrolase family 130 protein [Pedobacter sandarakinus]
MKKITLVLGFLISFGAQAQQKVPVNWKLGPFIRPTNVNPIISPDSTNKFFDPIKQKQIDWESNDTFNPAATLKDGKIYVLYRAEDKSGKGIGQRTSRIGLAESKNGTAMVRAKSPVLFPKNDNQKEFEWAGGCEDPRVAVTANGTYVMMYTQWNNKVPRLAVATSKDLKTWKKHGPAFRYAYNGKFFNLPTKSASILTSVINNKLTITKIKGKYWMYWGEANVYGATSTDLINWSPVVNTSGALKVLFSPRKGYFDSQLTECGPPAVLTAKGIVLMYNGKNLPGKDGDERYTANAYCAGQALFSAQDPEVLLSRLDQPFLIPSEPFEKSGQYPAGTVFIEGLVYFKQKWFLYYGCADSRVAVAIFDPRGSK